MVDMNGSGNISYLISHWTHCTGDITNDALFQVYFHILGWVKLFNAGSATHHFAPGSQLRVLCPIQLGRNKIFASILQSLFWKSYFTHLMIYLSTLSICHMTRFRFLLKINILSLGMDSPPTGELNKSCPTFVCRQKLKTVFHWRENSLPCISASFMWLNHYWTDTDM